MNRTLRLWIGVGLLFGWWRPLAAEPLSAADGFRGIWYFNQRIGEPYVFKYSGGLGTYCAKHQPFAVYCAEVEKTFFCYGGVPQDFLERFDRELNGRALDGARVEGGLLHMVSYFDHRTGQVARPRILMDKRTLDAHDNPVITVDGQGHLWIYSTAHGTSRPAYVSRSVRPYDIREFERITPERLVAGGAQPITNFSYMQAWSLGETGFAHFFTQYSGGRQTRFSYSPDGHSWSWVELAAMERGHYQISAASETTLATAFNYHPAAFQGNPDESGLNWRTNLYYMESPDRGETWRSIDGVKIEVPERDPASPTLVHNYEREGLLVYLKDIGFDPQGRPVILFVTSKGFASGPQNGPRIWRLARWTGSQWRITSITTSDNNYDMGSLYIESDDRLRIIAPTETGPQPFNPGGEVVMWESLDGGQTWQMRRRLTEASAHNHTYVRRPVNAHPDFYAFWADGHGRRPSTSSLYFSNRDGDVFRLPGTMDGADAPPILLPSMGAAN